MKYRKLFVFCVIGLVFCFSCSGDGSPKGTENTENSEISMKNKSINEDTDEGMKLVQVDTTEIDSLVWRKKILSDYENGLPFTGLVRGYDKKDKSLYLNVRRQTNSVHLI